MNCGHATWFIPPNVTEDINLSQTCLSTERDAGVNTTSVHVVLGVLIENRVGLVELEWWD